MAISKLTAGTALIAKSVVDDTIQKMHDVCKKHPPHTMSKMAGDSQHPKDIKWMLVGIPFTQLTPTGCVTGLGGLTILS